MGFFDIFVGIEKRMKRRSWRKRKLNQITPVFDSAKFDVEMASKAVIRDSNQKVVVADKKPRANQKTPSEIAADRIAVAILLTEVELNLSDLGLTEIPAMIGQLTRVERIDVSKNQITKLPEAFFCGFQQELDHRGGDVQSSLPKIPFQIISRGRFDKSEPTLLKGEDLDVPTYIRRGTNIGAGSEKLTQLRVLDASYNQLKTLPTKISRLIKLQKLILKNNHLVSLPDSLLQMPKLEYLDIEGNELLGVPPELVQSHNPTRILNYYFGLGAGERPLNEAKMILVGRGGVGKTSLVNRLVYGGFNPVEGKTDGISITQWRLRVKKDHVRLNIWDFGGQEIMHATHQFFLTKRSLYLIVLDAREGEQDANAEYWLRLIESFGGDSPVLVVINKVKDHSFDLNRRWLRTKFPSIHAFIQTDCKTGFGIEELHQAIQLETDQLAHLRDPFPANWFSVKDTLANLAEAEGVNFIPFTRYQELCHNNGVVEISSQETLVSFLHDLGIVVNFRDDPRLSETHVLNPEWVTKGIYKILNSEILVKNQGELNIGELAGILSPAIYPKSVHLYLMDLMRKFDLCYEYYESAGHYLVAELLGKEEPSLTEYETADMLGFEYRYNILPDGVLPRFIVRSRALNKNLPRWRTGVVLAWDENRAVLKADLQDRKVTITVSGSFAGRRRLLSVIRADMEHIHGSIPKLQVAEYVPVPEYFGLAIAYAKLVALESKRRAEFEEEYQGQLVSLGVSRLLNGVDGREIGVPGEKCSTTDDDAIRVAFSYSHKDEELRDQLETHLKLLKRQNIISTWHDRKILGGENWAGVIDDNFKRADLILLLVSADFIASDYCYEIELTSALEMHAKGEVRVVPVILRECKWQKAPFGKLQALPKNGEPIANWANRDKAWTSVADGIERVVEEMRNY